MTGYLQTVIDETRPYDVAAPVLRELLGQAGSNTVLDLASGSGGPWPRLVEQLDCVDVTLSDVAPPKDAVTRFRQHPRLRYAPDPISAVAIPPSNFGAWTMFTGLHHFAPGDVRHIMREAQERGVPFAAFEATNRSWVGILVTLLIPILVLLMMPRVKPRRALPLLLTYLPPILPLLIWWDGFASTLRTYTVDELESFVCEIDQGTYHWSVEELSVQNGPTPVLVLIGRPHGPVA